MTFTIVIILILVLIIVAIVVNAIQQHRERVAAEKRTEIAKQKAIIDETENVLMAADSIPITQRLVQILHQRIFNALRIIHDLNPGMADVKQRLRDTEEQLKNVDPNAPAPSHDTFTLPDNDKLVIQYIQAIKKFRILLRSEHSKSKIDTQTFAKEDKILSLLQLRVNVETLIKRANAALATNMMGSARQYIEKAIAALESQSQPDNYVLQRKAQLQEQLQEIQDSLKNTNAEDRARKREEEKNELDELFAPKKKW